MLAYLIAPAIIYFKVGIFNIEWEIVLPDTLKKGCIGGIILGISIWLKGKLRERQGNKG